MRGTMQGTKTPHTTMTDDDDIFPTDTLAFLSIISRYSDLVSLSTNARLYILVWKVHMMIWGWGHP